MIVLVGKKHEADGIGTPTGPTMSESRPWLRVLRSLEEERRDLEMQNSSMFSFFSLDSLIDSISSF